MDAREFIQAHADNACAGKIAQVIGDLTPEAMGQLGPLMAGAPNPVKSHTIVPVKDDGTEFVFDVTYSGDDGKSVALRDTVREVDGTWKIVKLEKPA
jgi:hypothetical protein